MPFRHWLRAGVLFCAVATMFSLAVVSGAEAATRWRAQARCSMTGAVGVASAQRSRENAAAIAVRNCIRAGGVPACCQVTSLYAYQR